MKKNFFILLLLSGMFSNLPAQTPDIFFTEVPPFGSFNDLQGQVTGAAPANHKVAVYIYTGGWWTKPTFANPLTVIQADGSWICDITTGGGDQNATRIIAFLIPNSYTPPQRSGGQTLPSALYQNALDYALINRCSTNRSIGFSGFRWCVKQASSPVGPGPNYFSDDPQDVWVDANEVLHMRIVQRNGLWHSTEVVADTSLGYGKYLFYLQSAVDGLDQNTVVGLFTWDDNAPTFNYREIDIEFSRWGNPADQNAQFVVQPYTTAGNILRFNVNNATNANTTNTFVWSPDSIKFQSYFGHATAPPSPGAIIQQWLYTGADNPPPGNENVRLNFWLMNGTPPSNGQNAEIQITQFAFIPFPNAPGNLTATAAGASQINLAWTDQSNNETGFKLERKTGASGAYAQIAAVGANVTGYSNTGLAAGATYFYRVRALNDAGHSAYSNEASATTPGNSNLALNKPATASSTNSSYPAGNAVDGSASTYWRSGSVSSSTVVWWRVDLGATYNINNVVIYWRSSYYAKKYTVQVSLTGSSWTTVYTDNAGNGGTDNVTFATAAARYVRVRITQNNSSTERVDEVQVYAAANASAKSAAKAATVPDEVTLSPNFPNPFSANGTFGNPTTHISFSLPSMMHVTLKIYNLIGEEVATLVNETRERGNYTVTFDASRLTSGVYFSVLQAGDVRQVRRLVLMK